jgi:hypothetical protein
MTEIANGEPEMAKANRKSPVASPKSTKASDPQPDRHEPGAAEVRW